MEKSKLKKMVFVVIVIAVVFGGYYGVDAIFSTSYEIPTTPVTRGEFLIALNENGTVDAKRAFTVSAPRVRGLQITWLA
ncbi:MAG: hypothetical protein AB1744_09920, partial [Candidatus Zixiibacteriota bacterium]